MGFGIIAGAMQGAGEAGVKVGLEAQKQAGDVELQKIRDEAHLAREKALQDARNSQEVSMVGVRETSRQAGRQADIDQDVSPDNVAKRATAVNDLSAQTLPGEIARKTALAGVETQAEIEKFTKLAPLKRQEAIDAEVAKLRAMSTPEMLKAERSVAMAKHIVDPSYTLIPNADGTVTTFDSKSGKSSGTLKGPDGQPIIRKDPEEMKAATAVINMANANLRVAEAAYKASASEMDPAIKASATAEWKNAQAEAKRLTAPAYVVLYAKAGIPDAGTPEPAAVAVTTPSPAAISYLKKNPGAAADFKSKYGIDPSVYLGGKAATTSGEPQDELTEPPGTPVAIPDLGVRGKGLINRSLMRQNAEAAAARDRQDELKAKGDGYGAGY